MNGVKELLSDRVGIGQVDQRLDENREFVPAHACDGIGLAHSRAQGVADGPEHFVANLVAEAVVDRLEVIQVHEDHRYALVRSRRTSERLLEPIAEQATVGKSGEWIEVRLLRQQGLESLAGDRTTDGAAEPRPIMIALEDVILRSLFADLDCEQIIIEPRHDENRHARDRHCERLYVRKTARIR